MQLYLQLFSLFYHLFFHRFELLFNTNLIKNIMSFFSNIGQIITKGLDGLKTVAKVVFTFGDDLVNGIKAIEATPLGATIIGDVEAVAGLVIPQQFQVAFKAWLPTFIKDMGWVQGELNKTDDQIVTDFVAWFNGLIKPNAKASVAHVLNANSSLFISDQTGAGVTIQQALTLPQLVHDPTIFDVPVAVNAPVKIAA